MEFSTFLADLALPDAPLSVDPASLFALLAQLPDPRKRRGRRYSLAAVLAVIGFLLVVAYQSAVAAS